MEVPDRVRSFGGYNMGGVVTAEFPELQNRIVTWLSGKQFGPYVVLAANDEGSVQQPLRGYIDLKIYEGAIWGEHNYDDGTIRNYSGYLKNGFIVLAYRSNANGYGEYFLAANSGDLSEYVGHGQINSCPGRGIQVVKNCNMVLLLAKNKDVHKIEDEGLQKYRSFLTQECQEVRFDNTQFDTNRPCPANKQAISTPLRVDSVRQR
jgi:hypothetical protein